MKVKELGEFGLIELLIGMVGRERRGPDNASPFGFRLEVDAGDDTAAWRCGQVTELCTTDTAVEGVHFTPATIPWQDLGWRIMAANVSDIAAMGGLPLYALVTLGLPGEAEVEDVVELYGGMLELSNEYGVAIVGGDVVRSPIFFVTVALTGVHDGTPLLRSAARPGELVAVTGYLGSSAGGLEMMVSGLSLRREVEEHLRGAHRRPRPCVAQGRALAWAGVRACIDISDGLVDDLSKLCKASGVAARVEAGRVPIHPLLREAFPERCLHLALGGGEDYQLLFTAPREVMERVLPQLEQPAALIGEVEAGEPGRVTVITPKGERLADISGGWDHFR